MAYALVVLNGAREGETFLLTEGSAVTIGRDKVNDICLPDRKLSRIHCQVEVIGGRCQIADLNSTNGTLVNGERIEVETWLSVNDEIEAGTTRFRLIESPTAELAATPAAGLAEEAPRCEECGREITPEEMASGRVRRVGDRHYCSKCSASLEESDVERRGIARPLAPSLAERCKPGRKIAGVRLLSLVGEGRVGPLFKGEQVNMGRLVAVKVLNVTDPDWARKYLHAVYASGQLVHPNIVLIFDTGEEDGLYYVIREYVDGESLQSRLATREPMALPEAFNIVTQAAQALEHASERRVFHGGLCPRRILIGPRETVKLTGFGLPSAPPGGSLEDGYDWEILPYMPPERLRADTPPDFQGDVYSLVAVFYHLLTGRPPFTGSTLEKIEHRILSRPPRPLADFSDDVPDAAQKIIDRGLCKDPRARYQSPAALLNDLEERLRGEI